MDGDNKKKGYHLPKYKEVIKMIVEKENFFYPASNNGLLQLVIPKVVGLKEVNPTIVEKILKKNSLHSKIG